MSSTEFSSQERKLLLAWAHRSIYALLRKEVLAIEAPTAHLQEPRGVFTTLRVENKLRGCIGFVEPIFSLYRAIYETAQSAASEDTRFYSINERELPQLQIEISVMSPPQPIRPEDVEIGVHGLIASRGNRRGLLLPQVATEWEWDREEFLAQVCLKAGLPRDDWKYGADLLGFVAEVFAEDSPGSSLKENPVELANM